MISIEIRRRRPLLLAACISAIATAAFFASAAKAADLSPILKARPAEPVQTVSGDISLFGGGTSQNINEPEGIENYTGALFGGLGRANAWLTPTMNMQLEVSGEQWVTSERDHGGQTVFNTAAHLDWALPGDGLFGGFASIGSNNDFCCHTAVFGTVAAEAQKTWSALTLYGQLGYSTLLRGADDNVEFENEGDAPIHGWYVHGALSYALTPIFDLGVNAGYAGLSVDEHDLRILRWGASLDAKVPASPFTFFVAYQGHHDDNTESGDRVTVHAFLGGVKLRFGGRESVPNMRVDYNPFTGMNTPRDAY